MSQILKFIAKYDENLTIAQLKKSIEESELVKQNEELREIDSIKNKFENSYLKHIDNESIFGKQLEVLQLKDYSRNERTTDWKFIYYFTGNKISFNKRGIFYNEFDVDRCGDSFSKQDLEKMTVISEKEYNTYLEKYNKIKSELERILL